MLSEGPMNEANGAGYVPGSVVPSLVDGGEWAACFGLSWADLMIQDQARPGGGRIVRTGGQYVRKVAGTMGVAAARSEIAAYFLAHTDAEWLFMVDSDMGFAPDTVDRMVVSAETNGVSVLGALCFAQKLDHAATQGPYHAARFRIQPTMYTYAEIPTTGERGFRSMTNYRRDAFQPVSATGAACVLIHRDALVEVGPEPFLPLTDPTAGGNGTPRTFSEDLSFCVRVHAAGLEMGVDTSIKTTHYKGGIFLDEVAYTQQQEAVVMAEGHAIARQAEAWMRTEEYTRHGLTPPRLPIVPGKAPS